MKYVLTLDELVQALAKKYDLETGRYDVVMENPRAFSGELVFELTCRRRGPPAEVEAEAKRP
ncbi:MAG TPA: hypothetical protein VF653_13265 [Methylomirabilota bacterium]